MQRSEHREMQRAAENLVRRVLVNYVYRRNMAAGYSGVRIAVEPQPHETINFKSLSEMKAWMLDCENARDAVNTELFRCASCWSEFSSRDGAICQSCGPKTMVSRIKGFDYWGLVGDHLYCGIKFSKMAAVRCISEEKVKELYWQGVSAIFIELVARDMSEEYVSVPQVEDAKSHRCSFERVGRRCPIRSEAA